MVADGLTRVSYDLIADTLKTSEKHAAGFSLDPAVEPVLGLGVDHRPDVGRRIAW